MNMEQAVLGVVIIAGLIVPLFLGYPKGYVRRNKYVWWVCLGGVIYSASVQHPISAVVAAVCMSVCSSRITADRARWLGVGE